MLTFKGKFYGIGMCFILEIEKSGDITNSIFGSG